MWIPAACSLLPNLNLITRQQKLGKNRVGRWPGLSETKKPSLELEFFSCWSAGHRTPFGGSWDQRVKDIELAPLGASSWS